MLGFADFDEFRKYMEVSTPEEQQRKIAELEAAVQAGTQDRAELDKWLAIATDINQRTVKWHDDNVQRAREQNEKG